MPQHAVVTSYKPGQPAANPGGRPKTARYVSMEALRFGVEAIHQLVKEMRTADSAQARINAATALLDRAVGKPSQALDHHVIKDIDKMSLEELRDLRDRMIGSATLAALEPPDATAQPGLFSAMEDAALGPKLDVVEPIEPDAAS